MKTIRLSSGRVAFCVICITIGWMFWSAGNAFAGDQAPPANLSPGLQEVVKLAQAHMSDDVILTYIKNSGASYALTADDILYLKDQGVSQSVINALLQSKTPGNPESNPVAPAPVPMPVPETQATAPATVSEATLRAAGIDPSVVPPSEPEPATSAASVPAPPPESASPAPATPDANFAYFHEQLAPYGSWVQVGGAWCWHPDTAYALNPNWRPYCDMGQWVYTDNGWFWQSDYAWGAIPFHYGRWYRDVNYGWLWVPGYTWGPAWVCWRHAEGYCGWAPLPPGAFFDGVGWFFNGRRVAVGVDFGFGLGEGYFTFVGYDHFREHFYGYRGRDYYHFVLPRERVHEIYRISRIENHFRMEHGRFVNDGLRERIEHFDRRPIEPVRLQGREIVRHREEPVRREESVRKLEEQHRELHSQRQTEEEIARKPLPQGGPNVPPHEAQAKPQQGAFHISESTLMAKAASARGAASRTQTTGSDNRDNGKGKNKDKNPNE